MLSISAGAFLDTSTRPIFSFVAQLAAIGLAFEKAFGESRMMNDAEL
jgi:hypothetical protein